MASCTRDVVVSWWCNIGDYNKVLVHIIASSQEPCGDVAANSYEDIIANNSEPSGKVKASLLLRRLRILVHAHPFYLL